MMDQSRMRREAAAAAVAAAAETATVEESDDSASAGVGTTDATSAIAQAASPAAQTNDDAAIAKLLSGPALPFLSTDPAVAPRNASATRPTHLSMRRMKSVEVLSKIIRERRPSSSSKPEAQPSVETHSHQISPTAKRCTPPRLTVSSPRGISSPKELALEGVEFEPASVVSRQGGWG